jgi:hypothetical protein
VKPVIKESINNKRLYKYNSFSMENVDKFIEDLNAIGLLITKEKKFFTSHRKSYTYWWIKKCMDMTVVHIDAHSDLYRNRQKDLNRLSDTDMGCDDYLWYAIRDGFISKLYWVVPKGLYDLEDISIAKKFLPESMISDCSISNGMLNINFNVITGHGEKNIDYHITSMDRLPCFQNIEMLTVATSPEFVPEACDIHFFRALSLIGASESQIERIRLMHSEMEEYA